MGLVALSRLEVAEGGYAVVSLFSFNLPNFKSNARGGFYRTSTRGYEYGRYGGVRCRVRGVRVKVCVGRYGGYGSRCVGRYAWYG